MISKYFSYQSQRFIVSRQHNFTTNITQRTGTDKLTLLYNLVLLDSFNQSLFTFSQRV